MSLARLGLVAPLMTVYTIEATDDVLGASRGLGQDPVPGGVRPGEPRVWMALGGNEHMFS
jgi:hypothetical protein